MRPTEQNIPISVSATLPSGDAGNATLALGGAQGARFECTAVSGLTGTVEGLTTDTGTWRQIMCWQVASGTYTKRAAGTTITFVSGDFLVIPTNGFLKVRIKRAAGTSATFTCRTCEDVDALIMANATVMTDLATGAGVLALGLRNDGAAYATQGAANGDPTEIAVDLQGFVRTALEALTITITPTIATGAIAATEVLFDLTALANAVRYNGGYTYLTGITVFDSDNEKAQLDFIFTQANTTALASGGVNNAPDISDANLIVDRVIGRATVGAGTYLSVTPAGNAVAAETFRPILMKAGAATTSIYVACTVPNAQNFTANNDLTIDFHFLRA